MTAALCCLFLLLSTATAFAAGRVVALSPVPLQILKSDVEAQKLTASIAAAIDRVPGVQAMTAASPAVGAPEFSVQSTLVIDPSNSANLTLYLFVTRSDGGVTTSCRWQTTGGAADLNKTLAKVDLSALFEKEAPAGLGTVLVIPQRLADLTFAAKVQNRLGNAHIATVPRNDVSLANTRAELSIACATAGARNILAWGVETDKEPRNFGFSGYHARVSFDLLNCLPTDYNPPSVSTGLYRSQMTNVPGVIASLGAILQTATRMHIAPIANILSGSTITAVFPQADETQLTQKAVDAAISENVDKLCDYLAAAQRARTPEVMVVAQPAPTATTKPRGGCQDYHPSPAVTTAPVTPPPS